MIKLLSLFSGIGAFEKALTNLNIDYEVVNYCEIDKYASKAYCLIHNEDENKNLWDITKVNKKDLPDFDLMTYGFPCQPFSMAGLRKGKLDKRGNLFFDSMRIAEYKKPKYMIAENVHGLFSIHKGQYFDSILNYLDSLGYNNYWSVLNAKDFEIPQNRKRIFIISIRKDIDNLCFEFPEKKELKIFLYDLLENKCDRKYYVSSKALKGFKYRKNKNNGFGFNINNKISNTITSRYYKDGKECLVQIGYINKNSDALRVYNNNIAKTIKSDGDGMGAKTGLYIIDNTNIRRLTPLECFRLMGFTDNDYKKLNNISDTQKYKMAGNSIVVNVLEAIFTNLFKNNNKKKWLF